MAPSTDPAATYRLLAWAIENRIPLTCLYGGQQREICPIILGLGPGGEEVLLAYQTGGASSGGPLRRPEWKCLRVAKLRRVETAEGEWLAGASHSQRQSCVRDVDYDVNEVSPYRPRRSLGDLRGAPD
jgi:hypothetical protein